MQHGRLQVVEHHTLGDTAELPERILQTHQERIGRLSQHDFAVGIARMAQQEIQLTFEGETRTFRRITIELLEPTRDGEVVMHLLTNLLLDVSGAVVATMNRRRWTIETLFAEVTETLACEIDTLCYPKAALFVFSLALLAANAVAVVKASLRAAHGEEKTDQVSAYYLALEIKQVPDGMMIALPAEN